MLGAKYDFSRDRERRAGVDDMVIDFYFRQLILH